MYNTTELEKILLKYPDKNEYQWDILTQRIDPSFIEKYKDTFPWVWSELSKNLGIDIDFINKYPNINNGLIEKKKDRPNYYSGWDWSEITNLPKISMLDIEEYNYIPWCFEYICMLKPNLTMDFIKDHPDISWEWSHIVCNPGITFEDIKNNKQFIQEQDDYYENTFEEISTNYNITMDDVINNDIETGNKEGFKWDWEDIASHPFIKIEEHIDYILEKMRSNYINDNGENNCEESELWMPIFKNRNNSVEFIEKNIDMLKECLKKNDCLLNYIVFNSNLMNDEFLEKHFDLLFGGEEYDDDIWLDIVQHKNVSLKFIEEHKDYYNLGYVISNSVNINVEYIETNIDKIDFNWKVLSLNEFGFLYNGIDKILFP